MVNRNSLFLFLADFVGSFIVSSYPLIFLAFLLPYQGLPAFLQNFPSSPQKMPAFQTFTPPLSIQNSKGNTFTEFSCSVTHNIRTLFR